ncbi:hypothetical protein BC829DRAFT_389576 [Chytridium lagenaria]|nr:hypothetical protein BC829DRAFT_389576 [Chytridium lagenaria]
MNRILDLIDELQKTPERLETLIHGKFYLTAVRTLISTIKTLNGEDLFDIGALESIRSKLDDLKTTLPETLLEELHNHIYLKSPFSVDRLSKLSSFSKYSEQRLWVLKMKIIEDLDRNPESDSFNYMKALLESLFVLGRLPDAIEIVRERLPVEVYYVVERTIQEVDRRSGALSDKASDDKHMFDLIGSSTKVEQASLLRDLLSNLFVKLEAIIDGHKFIGAFVNSKRDVWQTIQNEVKALLYDYLTNSNRTSAFANAVQIFRITGSTISDSLEKEYKDIVSSAAPNSTPATASADSTSLGVAAGHRLLVRPDPYNVLLAFKPTIAFSEKIEASIEFSSGTFKIFLEDFILNVFLPQMEERVLEYFHNFVMVSRDSLSSDAFWTESSQDIAGHPLLKSAIALIVLIQGMCRTLFAIPFYEKCLNRFRALMSGDQSGREYEGVGILSAGWACEDEIVQLLLQNTFFLNGTPDLEVNQALSQKETYIEMKLKKERSFHRNELIFEPRKLKSDWFISQVSQLRMSDRARRRIPDLRYLKGTGESTSSLENYTKWSTDSLPNIPIDTEDDVRLPLNHEMGSRFDSILNYYQELSETYLLLYAWNCGGNYLMEDEPNEPDPYVSLLNEDLINVEEGVNSALPTRRIRFLFDGLSSLITHTLCANLRYVKQVNRFGVMKLLRNVQSIQHCLTNIAAIHEKGLDRARDYFTLLGLSAEVRQE